jgi:hypothetical protein
MYCRISLNRPSAADAGILAEMYMTTQCSKVVEENAIPCVNEAYYLAIYRAI